MLSFYYLCRTGNNRIHRWTPLLTVVICFHFTIFVVLETTVFFPWENQSVLWFAFILLSLSYWKQPGRLRNNRKNVVICFHFTIFVVLETTTLSAGTNCTLLWFAFILLSLSYWKQRMQSHPRPHDGCDLLSFYYLCRTGNNPTFKDYALLTVVICFHFTIFVVLETTHQHRSGTMEELWFAFILLSLSYWKQRWHRHQWRLMGCDLLSFYYLCRTGNNYFSPLRIALPVVICFHFTIFVVLETTFSNKVNEILVLWFAFILLSLSYWKQLKVIHFTFHNSCDLLSFYYLCRTGNNSSRKRAASHSVVICFHFTIFVVLETTPF